METIIGAITVSVGMDMESYIVFFTDSRVATYRYGYNPGGGGALSTIAKLDAWGSKVTAINSNRASIVDYTHTQFDDKTLADFGINLLNKATSLSVPYSKINAVEIRKASREGVEAVKLQYGVTFDSGFLSKEKILIPGSGLGQVIELIKKTPLAGKLKQA